MEDRINKVSRLVERLERRMSRRPRMGLTPTFYARFGLTDPWLNAPADSDPAKWDDGFTLVSARPFYAMMRRLAQARWRRERRVSRFFERRSGVLTATRMRRFPGEIAAPIAALMQPSQGFMPQAPAQSSAWRGLPDLGGMALPQAWTPAREEAPAAQAAAPRRRRGSTARVSPVPWLSREHDPARVVRTPSRAAVSGASVPRIATIVREKIIEVEREESESFAARPSREQDSSVAPGLRGRSPATREHLTVEPRESGRAVSRPRVERELPAPTRVAAAAAAAEPEEFDAPRPAAPAQWAGLRLAHAARAADSLAQAVDAQAGRLPVAARRALDAVIVETEGMDEQLRVSEIRRVVRRFGSRVVREVIEEVIPEAVERPASVAAARALPETVKAKGLRPVLASSPAMQTVAPIEPAPEPQAKPAPRRAPRPAAAAWASSRSIGAASTQRGTSPVGRKVDAARAAATPASLSRSPVSRAPLARSAAFRTPAGRTAASAGFRTPAGETSPSAGFRTPGGATPRSEGFRTPSAETLRSEGFRTPSGETLRSEGFRTPSGETARSAGFRTPAGETARSEGFRTPSGETLRSEGFRTPSGETARSEGFRTPSAETARSEGFRTPSAETARSESFRTPAGERTLSQTFRTPASRFAEEDQEEAAFFASDEAPRGPAASAWAIGRAQLAQPESPAAFSASAADSASTLLAGSAPKPGGTSWAAERLSTVGAPAERKGVSSSILPRVAPSATDSAVVLTVSTPEEAEELASEVRRRNPKADVKVVSGASAWLSPGRAERTPKGLSLAAMRDIAPSVGYMASSVLRQPGAESGPAELRTAGPVRYARVMAPSATVLSPTEAAEPAARAVVGPRRSSPNFRTPRVQTEASAAFRTPRGAWAGSQTFRTPEGRYVPASSFRTPRGELSFSQAWRTPRGAWTGAAVFRTPSGEQLSRQLPAMYQPFSPEVLEPSGAFERPIDWAGSRAVAGAASGYRGAFAGPAPEMVTAAAPGSPPSGGASGGASSGASASPAAARGGRRDLFRTLGAVHRGEVAPQAPGWAERGTEEPRVRTAGDILRTLARASDEEEVVRIIIDRGQELKGSMNLASPVTKVIEEIRSRASSAAASAPHAAMLGGSAPASRAKKAGSTRSSARVISGWTGLAARSSASSTQGVGEDRIMKLVRKLKGLIHLAENQKSEAQRQVRLAASDAPGARAEGSGDLSTNEKSEQVDVDVEALAREVLEVVSRELELRQERRQEDPDVSIWW